MSDFVIRAAQPSDAEAIVMLLKELAGYEKLLDHFTLTEELVRRDMFGAACHCELAFHGAEAVGIATWFWTYKSFRALKGLYVEDLYVMPAYRGRGLGRQFLVRLAKEARAARGLMEWRVLDWNKQAIAFYESLGARLVPEWQDCRLEGSALERLS
ncbi:MAG TPA: GNAT family N-acetyltransferase [Rhizomicrobium sp.]|jgi:GNAT superfamily N-acetyltransferase|nr:GNAT family N-acetyltransferase [Rhizomicrobium sp.]